MKARTFLNLGSVIVALNALITAKAQSSARVSTTRESETDHFWFSVPIEVEGLPGTAEFVPIRFHIDFSELLRQLHVSGAVDERAVRLHRVLPNGKSVEEPFQFVATLQPRLKERHMLPDTPSSVSYLGEYAAGETPQGLKVEGELSWIFRRDLRSAGGQRPRTNAAVEKYALRFGVPRAGRLVQVPFPPQNLRAFDDTDRATRVRWFPRMQIHPQWPVDGVLHVFDDKQLIASYHLGPIGSSAAALSSSIHRPFLYPLVGPDGVSLTEFGKPHDPTGSHAHHYSLWIAHAEVDGKDFWSERGGTIVHDQFELMEDGPIFCELVQKARWVFQGTALLTETRKITFYRATDQFRIIDLDLEFACAGNRAVVFGKSSFGFLAARVAQSMTVFDGAGEIVNSAGDRNERNAHLKRAKWIDQSGPVAQGVWNGLAILDHPSNPNHPTTWHCRNDGWAGASFAFEEPYTLGPDGKLRLRYRVLLHRGNAKTGEVARRYDEYSSTPIVRFGRTR